MAYQDDSEQQLLLLRDGAQEESALAVGAAIDAAPLATRENSWRRAALLADNLSLLLEERVRLILTDNTSTMVSFRRARGLVDFRVHRMFVHAPSAVIRALADYARRGQNAGRIIDEYVRRHEDRIRVVRAERQRLWLVAFGEAHDLQAMFDELNNRYFDNAVKARIGWSRDPPNRRRRSIKMGAYFHDARVIRIHPALDRADVPDFFVAFIVFHEMLHQVVAPVQVGGKRVSHTPEFRRRERAYHDYERAMEWERRHLGLLLGKRPKKPTFDPEDPLA